MIASVYNFSPIEMLGFFMVLIRVSAFIVSWPVFGVPTLPSSIKVLFALVLSILVFPGVKWQHLQTELASLQIIWLAVREAFIGLTMGMLAKGFLYSVSIAGEITSSSMGVANAQLFSPTFSDRSTAVEQFQVSLMTLFFLMSNGHLVFISGLFDSFQIVPLSNQLINLKEFGNLGALAQQTMIMGIKLAAPVMIAVLFMNLAMAVVGRAVPQINVLIMSLPVNIIVSLVVLFITIPMFVAQMGGLIEFSTENLFKILKTF